MSETISILKGPGAPHDGEAAQAPRIKQAVALLLQDPTEHRVFVAGEEKDGVVPVTRASWLSQGRIVISDWGVTAKVWNSGRFFDSFERERLS